MCKKYFWNKNFVLSACGFVPLQRTNRSVQYNIIFSRNNSFGMHLHGLLRTTGFEYCCDRYLSSKHTYAVQIHGLLTIEKYNLLEPL